MDSSEYPICKFSPGGNTVFQALKEFPECLVCMEKVFTKHWSCIHNTCAKCYYAWTSLRSPAPGNRPVRNLGCLVCNAPPRVECGRALQSAAILFPVRPKPKKKQKPARVHQCPTCLAFCELISGCDIVVCTLCWTEFNFDTLQIYSTCRSRFIYNQVSPFLKSCSSMYVGHVGGEILGLGFVNLIEKLTDGEYTSWSSVSLTIPLWCMLAFHLVPLCVTRWRRRQYRPFMECYTMWEVFGGK